MGQIHVRAGIAKTKLQHCHARNVKALTQFDHVRRNVAQVLGKKG